MKKYKEAFIELSNTRYAFWFCVVSGIALLWFEVIEPLCK